MLPYVNRCKSKESVLADESISYWAKTSGTSGTAKLIPHTPESLSNWNLGTLRNIFSYVCDKKEQADFVNGKFAYIVASPVIDYINNIPVGYISGIAKVSNQFLNEFTSIPDELLSINNFDTKIFEISKYIIKENIIGIGGITSFSIYLLNYIKMHAASEFLKFPEYRRIIEPTLDSDGNIDLLKLWPNFQIFLSTGVILDEFKTTLHSLIGSSSWISNYYAGTEGAYAFTKNEKDSGMTLNIDLYFFEFRDTENGKTYFLNEVELGRAYEIIITAINGLYRYRNGDIVEFVNLNPYQVVVLGRSTTIMNLAGEKLNEAEISLSVNYALNKMNISDEIYFFFGWTDTDGYVHHCLAIELDSVIDENGANTLIQFFTDKLKSIRSGYKNGLNSIIKKPHYILLKQGTCSKLLKDKSKIAGNVGHSKLKSILSLNEVNRIINICNIRKHNLPEDILDLFREHNIQSNAS